MDVLELLSHELQEKKLNLEEAKRYLYLRSCELFTYDARYDFLDLFPDELERKEILRNRVIDLRNVEDNRVICTTYAREVYVEMIKELLGLEAYVVGVHHSWVKVYGEKCWLKADATISSDLARVKMGLSTDGYRPLETDLLFMDELRKIDQKLGYINTFYEEEKLVAKKNRNLRQSRFPFWRMSKRTLKNDDFIVDSWKMIQEFVSSYQLEGFTDFEFAISYLEHKFLNPASSFLSNAASFYQIQDNDDWEFFNIYPVELSQDILYYMLSGKDGNLSFEEITRADALYYSDILDGKRKELIR